MIGREELISDFKKLAKEKKLGHGYIFFGPPRVGKRLFASSLAHYLEHGNFAVKEEGGSSILGDALTVVPDEESSSIGIDQIRNMKRFLWQRPNKSAYRTAIIESGELLTPESQNALLKVAEEPNPSTLIILVIRDSEMLLPTLHSRFQKVYFPPLKENLIEKWLVNEVGVPAAKAGKLARDAHGAPGLAWAYAKDPAFQELLRRASDFVRANASRKTMIKDMVEDETFDLGDFLEAVSIIVGGEGESKLWHVILELRRDVLSFNLNPRLQLTALGEMMN